MARYYTRIRFHVIFATKARRRLITPEFETRLFPYLCGIARSNGGKLVAVNGVEDHIHMLLGMTPDTSLSTLVRLLKCVSSRWARFEIDRRFAWQPGYAAFSVSHSVEKKVIGYIKRQKEHHKKSCFEDEVRLLLKLHGVTDVVGRLEF